MEIDKIDKLMTHWHYMLVYAKDILGQDVEKRSICNHWAIKVFLANRRPNKKEKPLQLWRVIEKLVAFHYYVFILIQFANSKQMRSSFFSSKITVISTKETRPFVLSWLSNKWKWGDLLGNIYDKYKLMRRSGSDVTKTKQKIKLRAEKCEVAAIIHCKYDMVAYLHNYTTF